MKLPLKSELLRIMAGGISGLHLCRSARLRIMTFHSVQDNADERWHTPSQVFESQMRYLYEAGYHTCTISSIAMQWPDILKTEKVVALTFDDGLINHFTIVRDILTKFNMTATFFISTENIGRQRKCPISPGLSYFRNISMLSWDDIREMYLCGFEIGSHSHSHDLIAKLSKPEAFKNIATSKQMIESELGVRVNSFAYPYGHKNAFAGWTRDVLSELGFIAACTQEGGALSMHHDLLELPRIGIKGNDSLDVFIRKVNGCYDFLQWF